MTNETDLRRVLGAAFRDLGYEATMEIVYRLMNEHVADILLAKRRHLEDKPRREDFGTNESYLLAYFAWEAKYEQKVDDGQDDGR